jgi:hypothetical protein
MLVKNNHFTLFQLPGNLPETKKNVLPISVATCNFLFIYLFILGAQTTYIISLFVVIISDILTD